MRPLLTIVVALWVARGIGELAFCQERRTPLPTSTVTVVAVNIAGDPLPGTDVYSFVAEDETERVDLFQHDRASRVPYGRYRLSVQANGGYRETTLYVTVSAPEVRVTAALQWYGVENDLGLGRFRGRIVGRIPGSVGFWCRASGLYLRDQFDSEVSPQDKAFDFGEVPGGWYVLTCVGDRKVVVVQRVLRIWPNSEPFEVEYSPSQKLEIQQ